MTDEELRALVREAVARHLAAHPEAPQAGSGGDPGAGAPGAQVALPGPHTAFHRYALSRGDDGDGACLIEPKVRCNHCGFCQSHGF